MDDSEQDFAELCSRLLRRVPKKRKEDEKQSQRAKQKQAGPPCVFFGTVSERVTSSSQTQGTDLSQHVVRKMQRFKRLGPHKLKLNEEHQAPVQSCGSQMEKEVCSPPAHMAVEHERAPPGDEALALRLQQELDKEDLEDPVDLEEGGLFFCQICQRDLSALSPMGRAQHLNRCLDMSEGSALPLPSPPKVPSCPICGKGFKSQKSRATHLKRCSSAMSVAPATLLDALHRQAVEEASGSTGNQFCGSKRKGSGDSGRPPKKKPRNKREPLDENAMIAMALSRSLMEVKNETMVEKVQAAPALEFQWKGDAGKKRCKKKGVSSANPPLLLIQDHEAALRRLQDRVAVLLLRAWPLTPPSPRLPQSAIPARKCTAPLWQKSALLAEESSVLDFYTPELRPQIEPWNSCMEKGHPVPQTETSTLSEKPPSNGGNDTHPALDKQHIRQTVSSPVPSVSLGSQTLCDLMELAEEGMTLTQCRPQPSSPEHGDCIPFSGFMPDATEEKEETPQQHSVGLLRLAADLTSMVNNPQLSDVQLQVDTGDVFFAHSFMLYARCPLLAQMVHDSGFGVEEEGLAKAQRVLLGDVCPEATLALLQYIYTGHCPLTTGLVPHIQELAVRFDLQELMELCERQPGGIVPEGYLDPALNDERANQVDQNFLDLLRSMWEGEENVEEGLAGDAERCEKESKRFEGPAVEDVEERVDEDDLDEIYEFAATQRRMESSTYLTEKGEEEVHGDGIAVDHLLEIKEQPKGENIRIFDSNYTKNAIDDAKSVLILGSQSIRNNRSVSLMPNVSPETSGVITNGTKLGSDCTASNVHKEVCEEGLQFEGASPGVKKLSSNKLERSVNAEQNRSFITSVKSYSCLFSQSWGEYEETPVQQRMDHKPGCERQSQHVTSSKRVGITDLSVSRSTDTSVSSFPTTGQSPVSGKRGDSVKGERAGNIGNSSLFTNLKNGHGKNQIIFGTKRDTSSDSNSKSSFQSSEPELIVLSDSSEEMDIDLLEIDVKPTPAIDLCHVEVSPSKKVSQSSMEQTAVKDNEEAVSQGGGGSCDSNISPEVSWLIPGTPLHPARETCNGSSQIHISMRRAQLFPKSSSSSSCASYTSILVLPAGICHVSAPGAAVSDPRENHSSHSDVPRNQVDDIEVGNISSRNYERFKSSSGAPLNHKTQSSSTLLPYSSTPLQPDPLNRPTDFHHSLHNSLNGFDNVSISNPANAGAVTEATSHESHLEALKLSITKSSPQRGVDSIESLPESPITFKSSTNSQCFQSPVMGKCGECEVNSLAEELERQSPSPQNLCPLYEPPIAYNDSWEIGEDVGLPPPCFSLKMDSSGSSENTTGPRKDNVVVEVKHQTPSDDNANLKEANIWEDLQPNEEEMLDRAGHPLFQTLRSVGPANRVQQLRTPVVGRGRSGSLLQPITPMPGFSDMDTPELKSRLNRFGVRPLPKRQMVLKLKEIHQYTHQLVSSDSEDEGPALSSPLVSQQPGLVPDSTITKPSSISGEFLQPVRAEPEKCPRGSPAKHANNVNEDLLSASQGSTASSTAASEESEQSNPEVCPISADDSDSDGITPSQAPSREAEKLQAVWHFLQSDPELYGQILQYEPLVLSQLQARLKAAGIRIGASKLLDFLDLHCITFTTSNPNKPHSPRRRGRGRGKKRGAGKSSQIQNPTAFCS